jgi:hypothetical protein
MNIWIDNSDNRWIGAGTYQNLYIYDSDNVLHNITPGGLTAGVETAISSTSFGGGDYGESGYGEPRPESIFASVEYRRLTASCWSKSLHDCSSL